MQYLGGKSRIAKELSQSINQSINQRAFVSLFCGSCVIESKVNATVKICNDKHEYLIEMLKGVQNGYVLPDTITKEQYQYIREHKDEDKILSGFVGFGCSFGGKWFGGYAKNNTNTNYCSQSKRSLLKDMKSLQNTIFTNLDYKEVIIPENAVVYADPPYVNTTGYGKNNGIDYKEFWNYMRELSKNHIVFISEEVAPDDFECVWSKVIKRQLDVNKDNLFDRAEKLFKEKKLL